MIWQTHNSVLAVLLFAAPVLATSSAFAAPSKNIAPSCAPLSDAAAAKPASGAASTKVARPGASSVSGKPGAAGDHDDNDAKDFPPLKPGESFHLIGFSVSGSKHIDEDALTAALPEHEGDPITDAQIKADADKIKKALTARHVHFAEVTTSLVQRAGANHCVGVVWDIQHVDAFSQLPYQGFWKFGGQTFSGNKALTIEQLEKAMGLKTGERVREGAMSDAVTGMQQAYDKVFPGRTVNIKGKLKLAIKPARVATFEWQIIEPSTK